MAHRASKHLRTAALALALAGAGSAQALDLTVEVVNPKAPQGAILAALYAGADGWLQANQAAAAQRVPAGDTTVLVFRNLRPGLHAISLFHDENGNGQMDTTVIGLPLERYGFSRDARANLGPPGFADAAVDLQADTTIRITLQ